VDDLIGLIPAAGQARRLAPLSCSKEIFPLGTMERSTGGKVEHLPKPVGLYLIERMETAGVRKAFIIISKEKWDIPRYFGDGARAGMSLSYLLQENLGGMPFALDMAYPWVHDSTILFGMPDTIFYPENAFVRLYQDHRLTGADLTLGLFPTDKPERFGMVAFDPDNRMAYTVDKPSSTDLRYMWGIGCWGKRFSEFMHESLSHRSGEGKEVVLGDIFQAAKEAGLDIRVVPFETGRYIDIGNLDELNSLMHVLAQKQDN
jgi:glucose-1-phosphate thymidylyltransferase